MREKTVYCVLSLIAIVLLGAGSGNSETPRRVVGVSPTVKSPPTIKALPAAAASVVPGKIDCTGKAKAECDPKVVVNWNLHGEVIYILVPGGSSFTLRKSGIPLLNSSDRAEILQNIAMVKEGIVKKEEEKGIDKESAQPRKDTDEVNETKGRVRSADRGDLIQRGNASAAVEAGGVVFRPEPSFELAIVANMRETFCNDIIRTYMGEQCPRMKPEQCRAKCQNDLHIARFKKEEGVKSAQFRISNKPATPIRIVECSASGDCNAKAHDLLVTVTPNYYAEPVRVYPARVCRPEFHMEGMGAMCFAWPVPGITNVPCPGDVIGIWGDPVYSTGYQVAYWGNDDVANVRDSCSHLLYPVGPVERAALAISGRRISELDAVDRAALGLDRNEFDWGLKSRWWWDGQRVEWTSTRHECHNEIRNVNCREEATRHHRPCEYDPGNWCEETEIVCDTERVEVCENEDVTASGYCGGAKECDVTIEDKCGNVTHRSYSYSCGAR